MTNLGLRGLHKLPESDVEFELDDEYVVLNPGDDEPVRLEIPYHHDLIDDTLIVKRTRLGWQVGFLAQDNEPVDIDDWDGFGKFGTSFRRDSREYNEVFQEALGLDSGWYQKVTAATILEDLANQLDREQDALLRDPQQAASRDNLKLPYRGLWDKQVKWYRDNGWLGDPDAVRLNIYEHGSRHWEVAGTPGPHVDAEWDWAFGGGVWVPDDYLRNVEAKGLGAKERRAKMVEWAGQAVETMNCLETGDVYGVIIHNYTPEGEDDGKHDECWGFIGLEHAKEEMALEMGLEPVGRDGFKIE